MTLGRVSPGSADLGEVTVPDAYPVTLVVEDGDGNPVSDARIRYRHTNGGVTADAQFRTNEDGRIADTSDGSLELAGDVSFTARKGGREASESLTVTGETTVRLTLS